MDDDNPSTVAGSRTPSDGLGGTAALPMVHSRLPDFFIAGHPKCGTTALYAMLSRHPEIYMSEIKEPQFFASEMHGRDLPQFSTLPKTLDDYSALFAAARAEQRAGEASPSYLRSLTAAERIAEIQPAARIVVLLREPASFLHSVHLQFIQAMLENELDLRKAISLEDARRQGRDLPRDCYWPQALLYSEHIRYVEQLRRYETAFSREQMLVLIYEDFRRDNETTVRQVLRFLEVDDTMPIDAIEANPTVRVRSPHLYGVARSVRLGQGPAARVAKAAVKTLLPPPVRRRVFGAVRRRALYGDPEPPDEELTLELRRRFKGEVVALGEYLNRDLLTLWGYDRLG